MKLSCLQYSSFILFGLVSSASEVSSKRIKSEQTNESYSTESKGYSNTKETLSDVINFDQKEESFLQRTNVINFAHRVLGMDPAVNNQQLHLEDLVKFLDDTSISIPSFEYNLPTPFDDTKLELSDMELSRIKMKNISDFFFSENPFDTSNDIYVYSFSIRNLELDWTFNYNLVGNVLSFLIGGNAHVPLTGGLVDVAVAFASEDFDIYPPNAAELTECSIKLNIENINFDGGITAELLDVFDFLIRDTIENTISSYICVDLLEELIANNLTFALGNISEVIYPYVSSDESFDGNSNDNDIILGINLVDFSDTNSTVGYLINGIVKNLDLYLSQYVNDPASPGEKDLGINVFLRSNVLDENRTLVLPVDQVIVENDVFTNITVALDSIRVRGADSFTIFNPINMFSQTFSSSLNMATLHIDFKTVVHIDKVRDPLENSYALLVGRARTEEISVSVGLEDLIANLSGVVALDLDILNSQEFGSFLTTKNFLPCTFASLNEFDLSEILAKIGTLHPPQIDRFIDPYIGKLISDMIENFTHMYGSVINFALPAYVSTSFREYVTGTANDLIANITSTECTKFASSSDDKILDFRDLFFNSSVALDAGASGIEPYGDLGYIFKLVLDENFIQPNDIGTPKLNDWIAEATKSLFGSNGTIAFNDYFSICSQQIADTVFDFELFNFSLSNLDTFSYPFDVIHPQSPFLLKNQFTLGRDHRPIQIRLNFAVNLSSYKRSMNNFTLSINISKLTTLITLMTKIDEQGLMKMPLLDIPNLNCWLATIRSSLEPEFSGLGVHDFKIDFQEIDFNLTCGDDDSTNNVEPCESLHHLPVFINVMKSKNVLEHLLTSAVDIVSDLVTIPNLAFDEMIIEASRQCPYHAYYDPDYEATLGPSNSSQTCFEFDATAETNTTLILSRNGGKGLIFLLGVGLQLIPPAVLVVYEVDSFSFVPNDPLSAQNILVKEVNSLLDYLNLNETFLHWLDSPLQQVNSTLNNDVIVDSDAENDTTIGLNSYINSILNGDGWLTLPLDLDIGGSVVLKEVRLLGLDSFTQIVLVDIMGPQTLRTAFKLNHLHIEFNFSLYAGVNNDNAPEYSKIRIGWQSIDFSAVFLAAIKENTLGDLRLGSIHDFGSILECLISTVSSFNVTQLILRVGNFLPTSYNGLFSDETNNALTETHQKILENYEEIMKEALPFFSDSTFRNIINSYSTSYVEGAHCSKPPDTVRNARVDFRDLLLGASLADASGASGNVPYGVVWSSLYDLFKSFVVNLNDRGAPNVNDALIGPLTEGLSNITGTLLFPDVLFATYLDYKRDLYLMSDGNITVRAFSNTSIENLDTIRSPFMLMEPRGDNLLKSSVHAGDVNRPLRFSTRVAYESENENGAKTNSDLQLTLEVGSVGLDLNLLANMTEKSFLEFPLRDATNINCWLAMIPPPDMDEYGVRHENDYPNLALQIVNLMFEDIKIIIECNSCEAPEFSYYSLTLPNKSVADAGREIISGDLVQNMIDRTLKAAASACPHNPEYGMERDFLPFDNPEKGSNSTYEFIFLFSSAGIFFSVVLINHLVMKRLSRRNHIKWLLNLSDEDILHLYLELSRKKVLNAKVDSATNALVASKEIPALVRITIPIILMLNIALFVSGHLDIGARIDASLTFAGESLVLYDFYRYSVLNLVKRTWKWGNKYLAAVVFACSVIWPYVKQVLTLMLWLAPPRVLSVKRRGTFLETLDSLAKWSFIDIFIIFVGMTLFFIDAKSNEPFPGGYYGISMILVPEWGLYSNLLAQILSQVTSQMMIYYHRKMITLRLCPPHEEEMCESLSSNSTIDDVVDIRLDRKTPFFEKKALCDHSFCLGGARRGKTVKVSRKANFFLFFFGLITAAAIVAGSFLRYFRVETTGVVGMLVERGQESPAVMYYSVFTVTQQLIKIARMSSNDGKVGAGTYFLAVVLMTTCLVVPLAQLVFVMTTWFVPTTRRTRKKLTYAFEILQAWQYLEVYFLGTLIMFWQAGPTTDSFMYYMCLPFEGVFASLFRFGYLEEKFSTCLYFHATFEPSVSVHLVAAVMLWWITRMVDQAAKQGETDDPTTAASFESDSKTHVESEESGEPKEDVVTRDKNEMFRVAIKEMKGLPLQFTDYFQVLLVPSSS